MKPTAPRGTSALPIGQTFSGPIGIGVSGLFLTGLIAGIAVYAMRTALTDRDAG